MKTGKFYFLYLVQLVMIGIFALVLLGYSIKTGERDYFENEMFSKNVRGLQMSDPRLNEEVNFTPPQIVGERYMIWRYLSYGESEIVRGIFGTDDIFGFSSLIGQGRFFTTQDYTGRTRTAVLGDTSAANTVEHGGKKYYVYNNTEYEVIGTFAKQNNTADRAVFLNLNALDAEIDQTAGIYYVDAADSATAGKVIDRIRADVNGAFTINDVEFEPHVSIVLGKMQYTLLFFSSISVLLCLVITGIFLVTGQRYKIAVRKLCGMTKKDFLLLYGKLNLVVGAAAYILIFAAAYLLSHVLKVSIVANIRLEPEHYILTGILLFAIGVCNTLFTSKMCDDVDISCVLKGI